MTAEVSIDLPVVFLSKQVNRVYIAPQSQSHRLNGHYNLYSERHRPSSDARYERGKTCSERKEKMENQQSNVKFKK